MDSMEGVKVSEYFICPISLEVMRDPVTTVTGITYDRESIDCWLAICRAAVPKCPVTMQPLPRDSNLTPNHTLRCLIRAWCDQNNVVFDPCSASNNNSSNTPMAGFQFVEIAKDLSLKTLRKLEAISIESKKNRRIMADAGVPKAVAFFVVKCFREGQDCGLEEALSILKLLRITSTEASAILAENDQIINALSWVLQCDTKNISPSVKSHALLALKSFVRAANRLELDRLKPEFFGRVLGIIRQSGGGSRTISQQGLNAALQVLLDACVWGPNRGMMVGAGAVFDLLELEIGLSEFHERTTTELSLGVLFHLCRCAEGRAGLLSHPGGISVVSKRILRVSPAADDRAVSILAMVSRFAGTQAVAREMAKAGAVAKLCMVVSTEGVAYYLKERARETLRAQLGVWRKCACVSQSLLVKCTKQTRV